MSAEHVYAWTNGDPHYAYFVLTTTDYAPNRIMAMLRPTDQESGAVRISRMEFWGSDKGPTPFTWMPQPVPDHKFASREEAMRYAETAWRMSDDPRLRKP